MGMGMGWFGLTEAFMFKLKLVTYDSDPIDEDDGQG